MPRTVALERASQSRVFIIEDTAGPNRNPAYFGLARAGAATWDQGTSTPVRVPSDSAYGQFEVVDRIQGQKGLPTLPIEFRKQRELSEALRIVRNGCPIDVQIHIGACKNPSDFDLGWELIIVLEDALPTSYGTSDLGAFDADQDNPVVETIPWVGLDYYEIKPIAGTEVAAAQSDHELIGVVICDSRSCGECGLSPSDGCQKVFILSLSSSSSPGLPAEVIYSGDGGVTWHDGVISTLGATEDPSDIACVGSYICVSAATTPALHYAATLDVLAGTPTWVKVTTGFVAAKGPNNIWSMGRTRTWFAGNGGYIYFSSDITAGVTAQQSGGTTTQDLLHIHGCDELNLVACGKSNAVLHTVDGGETWAAVTGPAVGVQLNTVWMLTPSIWFIGSDAGNLYYTTDSGATWTLKTFPGSGAGTIKDIWFSNQTVGYMAHTTATPRGRILRTIDGGFSWYVLPEGSASAIPNNQKIDCVTGCDEDVNLCYGVGLAAVGTDGFAVKVA